MSTDDASDTDAAAAGDASGAAADEEGIDRRRLVRWIAVLALAIPVVVELFTFGGLIRRELFGVPDTPTATPTSTHGADAVGVGEELLAETAASETVLTSEVRASGDVWTYVFRVEVDNGTDVPVELRVEGVQLRDGSTVEGTATTGRIPPGEKGELTRAWDLPGQEMPTGVAMTGFSAGESIVSRTVPVERPPVRG